jgi:hypothetical protein
MANLSRVIKAILAVWLGLRQDIEERFNDYEAYKRRDLMARLRHPVGGLALSA